MEYLENEYGFLTYIICVLENSNEANSILRVDDLNTFEEMVMDKDFNKIKGLSMRSHKYSFFFTSIDRTLILNIKENQRALSII